LYGADSFIEHSRYPKTTFIDMIKLVGQEYSEEKVQSFVNDYYWMNELVEDDRGMIAYKVIKKEQDKNGEDVEEEQILYSEEVVSMMLKYGKKLAETQAEGTVRECVITVPSYFG
jgi:molecular chaperone DnaK (HSP70)